jgi:EAL domain-containing protein (putative c-di-GMP-specific phosphodiesterase class I)
MESKLKVRFIEKRTRSSIVAQAREGEQLIPLEARLIAAVRRRELKVHFQPQYDVDSGQGFGVEALARWTLPDGADISPTVFIPMAERISIIRRLGAWVLGQACETVARWGRLGGQRPTLSVNVSTHQMDERFCGVIDRILKTTGLPPGQLELEITESAIIADTELAIACCEEWRTLGVHIALDDFGTGYSSLNYLARLPVDRVKLDKSFAERTTFEKKTAAIVRSLLALGKEMGVAVLVEGVETEQQFALLERLGCRQVQGYLLAKPCPAAEARALLLIPWGTRFGAISRSPLEGTTCRMAANSMSRN